MTRPMPGPPGGFTDRARLNYALLGKQITYEQYQEFGDALTRAFTAKKKHLTDVECAAHEWQAKWRWLGSVYSDTPILPSGLVVGADPIEVTRELDRHKRTWERFANHPHALDADEAAS